MSALALALPETAPARGLRLVDVSKRLGGRCSRGSGSGRGLEVIVVRRVGMPGLRPPPVHRMHTLAPGS